MRTSAPVRYYSFEFSATGGQRLDVIDVGLRRENARLTPAPTLAVGRQQGFSFFR
ncbi:hypothetical protein ACSSZE_09275 [Acidithiobacillus caldus]